MENGIIPGISYHQWDIISSHVDKLKDKGVAEEFVNRLSGDLSVSGDAEVVECLQDYHL